MPRPSCPSCRCTINQFEAATNSVTEKVFCCVCVQFTSQLVVIVLSSWGLTMDHDDGKMQPQLHYQQVQKQQLTEFWGQQRQEMEQVNDFKTHHLPLARIKKIMKSDEDVKMIAAEAPVLFSKACEMFILELTLRSWIHTEENKRRTLQRNDIAGAITRGDIFDFLVDIVPRDELKEEDLGVPWSGVTGDPVQYGGMYYPAMPGQQMHHPMGAPEMMVGQPAISPNAQMMYQPPQAGFAPEQQQMQQQQQQQQQQMQ